MSLNSVTVPVWIIGEKFSVLVLDLLKEIEVCQNVLLQSVHTGDTKISLKSSCSCKF